MYLKKNLVQYIIPYLLDNDTVTDKKFAVTKQRCNEIILKWLAKYNSKNIYPLSKLWFIEFLKQLKERYKYENYCTAYVNYENVFNNLCIPLANDVDTGEQKEKKYKKRRNYCFIFRIFASIMAGI